MTEVSLQQVKMGRIASARIGPNQDLVDTLHHLAAELGFRRAVVRTGLGSLVDATLLSRTGERQSLAGPAIEILTLSGEIALDDEALRPAGIFGVVSDTEGMVWAGRLMPGHNLVCVTVEVVLEEILPA